MNGQNSQTALLAGQPGDAAFYEANGARSGALQDRRRSRFRRLGRYDEYVVRVGVAPITLAQIICSLSIGGAVMGGTVYAALVRTRTAYDFLPNLTTCRGHKPHTGRYAPEQSARGAGCTDDFSRTIRRNFGRWSSDRRQS
jgi:hypothetical protein